MLFIKLQQPGYKTVQYTEYWVNCHTGVTEKAVLLLFLPLLLFFFSWEACTIPSLQIFKDRVTASYISAVTQEFW